MNPPPSTHFLRAIACSALLVLASHGSTRGVAEQPWKGAERIESNGGGYVLFVRPSLEPLPQNEVFGLAVWVFDPAQLEAPLGDVELVADAGMPEHGHGMSREPQVARREDGGFDVSGMLFHMGGTWELYLDVTRGALTERTQRTVELE
jgi:hypothetical protein